ncbi:ATP-binding protein [Streptomyces sp. NPDC006997]|uniref:ATP-binding protein n=1 Tax=Streptomyces sp. NPDC006997 TaxID=3155356 RepID=UPI0033E4755A
MTPDKAAGGDMTKGATSTGAVPTVTEWPEWHPDGTPDSHRSLARYVSVQALWDLDLLEHQAHRWEGRPLELLEQLYTRLRRKNIPYNKSPWSARAQQRVRDPQEVDRSSGTCLDLTLMLAAMCEAAGLRPYVTVLEDHALLLVHTDPAAADDELSRPPVTPVPDHERGVFRTYGQRLRVTGGTAVDPVHACHGVDADFATACRSATAQLEGEHDTVRMVDVVALHATGDEDVRPLPVVRDESRAAIHRRLPPRPPFVEFGGRGKLVGDLHEAAARGGTVVLHGPQGVGKSMLAHHLAARAGEGRGWFLEAFDQRTLTASLGDAEIDERGLSGQARDSGDRSQYAALALERLSATKAPWVVVLDNVEVEPEELHLPRATTAGQLVVVTTTRPEPGGTTDSASPDERAVHHIDVAPLCPEDAGGLLDAADAPLKLLEGRPLLLEASARLLRTTGLAWWRSPAAQPDTVEEVPAAIWSAMTGGPDGTADGPLRDPAARDRRLATAMAWLPPSALSPALLALALAGDGPPHEGDGPPHEGDGPPHEGDGPPHEVAAGLDRLHDLGLVDFTGGRATMHRLFRGAVQDHSARHAGADTAVLVGTVYRNLFDATHTARPVPAERTVLASPFDLVLVTREVKRVADLLAGAPSGPDAFRDLHALGVLVQRQDTEAATYCFHRALERADADGGAGAGAEWRVMRSDCLRGRARAVHNARGASPWGTVGEAVAWAVEARNLCDVPGAGLPERLAASRAEAMHGLLIRKQARAEGLSARERLELLREAEPLLRRSAAERARLTDADSPDVDRSRFNLAGLEVALAQVDPSVPPRAHLDAAEAHYEAVLRIRQQRYHTRHLEEVITCVNGLALVNFYRAVLQDDLTPAVRVQYLMAALRHAREALEVRQSLVVSVEGNVLKSLDVLAKAALARLDAQQLVRDATRAPDASERLYRVYRTESGDGRFTPAPQERERS